MKNILFFLVLISVGLSCKKKNDNPVPSNVESIQLPAAKKRAVYLDEVFMSNINPIAVIDTSKTCFNFAISSFTKWKKDSFDLCYHVYKLNVNSDTLYYNLSGPSHSSLRLNNTDIRYVNRNTTFYVPKSESSFYKSIYDTIMHDATLPKMIADRFTKLNNEQTGEAASITIKGAPFYQGQIIGFKTTRGKFGILRILSDGKLAGGAYIKFEVKYQN